MGTRAAGRWTSWLVIALATLVAFSLIGVPPSSPAQAGPLVAQSATAVPDPVRVRIVDVPGTPATLALQPSTVVLVPGQTVVIENASNAQQEVEAADGSFYSGPIAPGGAFVAAIDDTGSIPFATVGTPAASGRIVFGLAGLAGSSGSNARSAIPSLQPPTTDLADFAPHPVYGQETSTTSLLVVPAADATVGQVNDALASVRATIVGAMDVFDTLVVAVPRVDDPTDSPDLGDHAGVLRAMDALRASPAFRTLAAFQSSGAVAPVWLEDVDAIPAPYDPDPAGVFPIFSYAPGGWPTSGDWGLTATRAPQAWNTLDLARITMRQRGAQDTVIFDAGFDTTHPDLDFATVQSTKANAHGTHVSSTVGAIYDNRSGSTSRGLSGVNPVARLHAVEFLPDSSANIAIWNQILEQKRPGGTYPNLRVINASFGLRLDADKWQEKVADRTCGPSFNDDNDPSAATGPCLPSTLDRFVDDMYQASMIKGGVIVAARDRNVIIVKSAGNGDNDFCTVDATPTVVVACVVDANEQPAPGTTKVPMAALVSNDFALAKDFLRQLGTPVPLLIVGAVDALGSTAAFSQGGGDLSAPGVYVRGATIPDERGITPVPGPDGEWYGELSGTSMAAPHVTGAVGYLLQLKPDMTAQQAVDLIIESARSRSSSNPRLDLFDVVLRAVGIRSFADANDASADGNRRVVRTADGWTTTDTVGTAAPDSRANDLGRQRSQPDGKVDLRDVRALRDAWLQTCLDGSAPDAAGPIACPPVAAINLDGAADHRKRDGNGDGCVRTGPTVCLVGEARYNRFDLNGDGLLAINTKAPVPVDASGAISSTRLDYTDFELMALALDPGEFFDGWARDDIANGTVLRSADITLDLTQVPVGTTGVRVSAKSPAGNISSDVSISAQGVATPAVLTVPVAPGGSEVKLSYSGTRNGTKVSSGTVVTGPLRYGEDTTVALCEVKLRSEGPAVLAANQSAQVRVSVKTCTPGVDPPQLDGPVTFTVTPVDPASASSPPVIGSPSAVLDVSGTASTIIAAGTSAGTFRVRATIVGPAGEVVQTDRIVRVVPRLEVRYRWEAEVTSVDVTTSSDWPDAVPGRPDCREVGAPDGCLVNARTTLAAGAPTPTVTRDGTITLDARGVTLDESVGGRAGSLSITYGWEDLTTATSTDGSRTFTFGPLPGQSVTDRPVPVDLSLDSDGSILVDGFRLLAEIPYESGVVNGATSGPDIQPDRLGVPGELLPLSVPQPGSVQHSASPTDVTRLRASGGGFVPVSWCGTVATPIARAPGYRLTQQNDLIDGAVILANDPVYAPGKVPMPAGSGSFGRRIRVSFTAARDGAAPDPVLPACTGTASPTAAFDVAPQADGVLHEGDAIRFLDRSTDPDGDLAGWSWSFGGGRASSSRNPVLVPGLDDGAREVSLRVADAGGRFSRVYQTLDVVNVLPTVTPVSPLVTVQEGERATIAVRLDDPGPEDRTKLVVRVAEGSTELLLGATYSAGTVDLTLPALEPGVHAVTVYVYDGNRQFVEVPANVTVAVVDEEVPPPPGPLETAVRSSTCAGPVSLSSDEAALLQRWNATRERSGLPALGLSAELSDAASTLAGASLGVLGLAPNADVGKTADDAGYAGLDVRALPFSRDLDPADVLEGLRASEPSTIFTTTGRMVGLAKRAEGSAVKWVVIVGDVVDCDVAPLAAGGAPQVTVTPPAVTVVEGARVELGVTATDPDGDLAEVRVDWGDGFVGGTAHRYRDDGEYDVRVRALDERGNLTLAPPLRLTVTGAAPDVDVVIGELVAGAPTTIEVAAADPAEGDRPLQLSVSSVPAEAVSFTGIIDGGRTLRVVPPTGSTQLDLTVRVTDDDGETTVRTFSALPVAAAAGAPPTAPANVLAPPPATCPSGTAGVTLRAQASGFLTGANALRASFGSPALVVSKELQAAAEQHLADLVANRYFAHIDAAGRTPLDRARANGYTGGVGENIALRFVNGAQVLLGWRSSPVHLENLLDPVWNATGVAVGNSPTGVVWVQVFGTAPTCPTVDRTSIPAPVALSNPLIDASAPVASWPPRATAPVPAASPLPQHAPVPQQTAPQQATAPTSDATVAAFTIDDLDPLSGATVLVTNRSRVDGTAVSATLAFGSVTGRSIAPDASFSRAVFSTQNVAVAAAGATATVAVSGSGSYVPQVTILSPAASPTPTFDQGAAIPVQVLVTDGAATPTPLAGVRVRARVSPPGADYVIGATGADGKATLTVRPTATGAVVLEVQAETVGADTWQATTGRNLTIVANTAPVFPPIDALTVELQRSLRLWVPAAVDADVPVAYSWDLDGNGTFGDLGITSRDTEVSWADVAAVICGGVCTDNQAESVTIRATDSKGASTDAAVTVTPVRDFQVVVNPQRLSLPPGGSTVVAVTVPTTSGFNLPVTLSTSGLPVGITAALSPPTISPGEIGYLTLSVSPSYTSTVPIPLAVTGTATDPVRGTITRTATPNVNVLIGLDRICTVRWGGTIRDALTRQPLAGATVRVVGVATVITDADGRWSVPTVPVASDNSPLGYYVEVERTGYHSLFNTRPTAICDADRSDIDVDLHERKFVPMTVQVRDAGAPTVVPAGTTVEISSFAPVATGPVDVDGRFTALLPLSGPDNRPAGYLAAAQAPGYHSNVTFRNISLDALPGGVSADIAITRICSARFVGGTVIDADGRLVPGARVSYGGLAVIADANARFSIERDVALGANDNRPVDVVANASPPNDRPDLVAGFGITSVDQCGTPFEMTIVLALNPNGPERFATLQGRFLSPTGTPIPGGRLTINGLNFFGNNDGTYSARLNIGRQNAITGAEPPPAFFFPFANAGGTDSFGPTSWWGTQFSVQLAANEVRTYDIVLDPVRYGTITGALVDAGTGAPLANRTMDVSSNVGSFGYFQRVTTGADGRFAASGMRQRQSGPTTASAGSGDTASHWSGRASTPFVGDPPTADLLVPAIAKCAPASVNGIVVENAPPNLPLADVTVQLDTGEQAITGTNGKFSLNAGPYFENAPREVTITASKTGFVNATRRVFIFCGATLVVDFAPPSPTTGTITGRVTRESDGTPVADVFVGTEYGGGTLTDADGRYSFSGAPPNPDGSARLWKVSAVPEDASGLLPATVSVPVTGGQESIAEDLVLRDRDTLPVNTPPVAVITPNGASVPQGTRVDFSATSSSDPNGDQLTYAWDLDADGSVDGTAATFPLQLATPGARVLKLTVADGRGAAGSTQVTATFTNVDPTVVIGGDVTIGPDGIFARTGRFDDPGDGDQFAATVDWGDGSGVMPLDRFARTLDLAHTFPGIGQYRVVVKVCDADGGCGERTITVTVASEAPNLPPVARLTGPLEAVEGETLSYDASASTDPEGQALTFAWDLDAAGDFDDASGPVARVAAGAPGTRTLVVAVTDAAGAVSVASLQLTVRAQPAPTTTTPAPVVDAPAAAVPTSTPFVPQPTGRLPETGADTDRLLIIAAWLTGVGALLVAVRRRRLAQR